MKWILGKLRRALERSILNPWSWLAWAAILFVAWGACHLLGWRSDTAVISGTADPAHGSMHEVMLRGTMYAVTYFAAVIVGPVLVLASAILGVLIRVSGGRNKEMTHDTAQSPIPHQDTAA